MTFASAFSFGVLEGLLGNMAGCGQHLTTKGNETEIITTLQIDFVFSLRRTPRSASGELMCIHHLKKRFKVVST